MTVSMDGLRWQLLDNYNSLTRKLNKNIDDDRVRIDVDEIQNQMDNIRSCIVTLAYMFDKREDGFDILQDPHFEEFNPEVETKENY
jgi:hypothetical protein